MKLLAELTEELVGVGSEPIRHRGHYILRRSARAIVLNEKGEMAVQHIQKRQFHKLPGGGIEEGEIIEEALRRELREEVGCEVEILRPVGMVIEYQKEMLQISYCFVVQVLGEIGPVSLEAGELADDQITEWIKPSLCLELMNAEFAKGDVARFKLAREIAFLQEYLATI